AIDLYLCGGGDLGAVARASGRFLCTRLAGVVYGVLRCVIYARSHLYGTCASGSGVTRGGLLGVGAGGQFRALLVGQPHAGVIGRLAAGNTSTGVAGAGVGGD